MHTHLLVFRDPTRKADSVAGTQTRERGSILGERAWITATFRPALLLKHSTAETPLLGGFSVPDTWAVTRNYFSGD